MRTVRNHVGNPLRTKTVAALAPVCVVAIIGLSGIVRGADEFTAKPQPMFAQYCFQCHGKAAQMGGISLEQLTAKGTVGDSFAQWTKVAAALEQGRMPPKGMPQPSDEQRHQAVTWVHAELAAYAKKHEGDPGRVTVRRLTSGEYGYAIEDLTGLKLDVGIDASSDSVGGEGFTNFGDVQFMQEANLERYLEAAKKIADHAVIGAGPIEFFADPGKTGFELSAITRLKDIYGRDGFRTVSGEGGGAFGLDKYGKAFYAAWRYHHRAALGEPNVQMKDVASREQVSLRLAQHIYATMNRTDLGYPSSEMAARWRKLPAPAADVKASAAAVRAQCEELQKYLTRWPGWLFSRGDEAFGGAGDESPLIFNDASLKVSGTHHFVFNAGGRGGGAGRGRGAPVAGPTKVYLNVVAVTANPNPNAVVVWHNANVTFGRGGFGRGGLGAGAVAGGGVQPAPPAGQAVADKPPVAQPASAAAQPVVQANAAGGGGARRGLAPPPGQPLRTVISEEMARKLNFGKSPDGATIGPDDFASDTSVAIEILVPEGSQGVLFQVDAQMGKDRDQVFRITLSDREDGGSRGIPVRTLLGDPDSTGYKVFKAGVMELAATLPPNSHNEPTPADKDPVPLPFDSTYNVPEHDEFDTRVKYLRDDKFVYTHILDDATRKRVDQAWADLYTSFEYHDNYLDLLAKHYKYDLKGKHIGDLDKAQLDAMPAELRNYVMPVRADYLAAVAAEKAALPHHMQDCLKFAGMAWRRPLSEKEKQSLMAYYDRAITLEGDHQKAIRAVIARILVSPAFLYRVEQLGSAAAAPAPAAAIKPLADWEMASRLSFFLWASIPDEELRRAAAAGELSTPPGIQKQVKRMLADAKARRLSTEFFGQWLGFYHFDEFKGVDTTRFPEFTADVRDSMYDEAVSFFEHIVRKDRPVREILTADYAFLDQPLAKFYGIKKEVKSKDRVELVEGANEFQRGGVLRLGAVLTATSAPLRTSPVKRGDWVLRRVLGTAVPPPPADAGSIPADDKLFGGLSLKAKLEQHKRNATCAACHMRIDPLGFPLEHYDSTGRWREKYADGKPIEDTSAVSEGTEIAGVQGLLKYLQTKDEQVRRTLSSKLLGYALGRTVQASDQTLIDRMVAAGSDVRMSQLAGQIATSKQFRNHTGPETAVPAAPVKVASAAVLKNSDKVGSR